MVYDMLICASNFNKIDMDAVGQNWIRTIKINKQ